MSDNIQKNYYAIIPANVRYDKRLTLLSRLLYGEITALCNEKGYCWASNSYFAELYEVNNKTISRTVQQLEECGHIKCVYDKTQQNNDKRKIFIEYRQKCPDGMDKNVQTVETKKSIPYRQKCPDGMDKNVQTVETKKSIPYRQKCPDGMDKNVQHNNTYNNTNNNTEREKEQLANDEVEILLNHTQFSSFEDFEKVYIFWFTKLTGRPVTLLNQTVSVKEKNIEQLNWLRKNFEARRVHAGIAIFETLEYIAQDKTCKDNYDFRGSNYLRGVTSRLVDAKLAESDPVSNEGKGKYRNPSFDYFLY